MTHHELPSYPYLIRCYREARARALSLERANRFPNAAVRSAIAYAKQTADTYASHISVHPARPRNGQIFLDMNNGMPDN